MEALGVDRVKVKVEWKTTGKVNVCPKCKDMQGVVFTVKEARGLLPRHIGCCCEFTPARNKRKGQIRDIRGITRSIKKSLGKGADLWDRKNLKVERRHD